MTLDLSTLTIAKARELLLKKEVSAVELAEEYLRVIAEKDGAIHAYLEVFDDVLTQAREADEKIARGEEAPLLGIPLAIKDNILIKGKHASAGSKILESYTATYDATVIKKLKDAGAIFLGRTNMDEFALGGSTENSAYGPTRNPHDLSRVAGGTSGGSAAAVAGGMAIAALGSDTGGSVRNPASFCGVVGLKPTYGNVSRSGLIAAVSSFDQIGPLTKTVGDAKALFDSLKGRDPNDSTSIDTPATSSRKAKRIGVPRSLMAQAAKGLNQGVAERFEEMIKKLGNVGYEIIEIEIPSIKSALASYYIVNFAEVSSNLARFDGVRYGFYKEGESGIDDYAKTRGRGFGKEVRRRILLGTYVLSAGYYDAYYGKANILRDSLSSEMIKAFQRVDCIVTPTMPTPAFKVGGKSEPVSLYLEDIFTVPANLTGLPAISVPMGGVKEDGAVLPVGIQFTAPYCHEQWLFDIGEEVERLNTNG